MKKWNFNISEYKKIIKNISIDKWLLMGVAGIVLVLCSDSCNSNAGNNNGIESNSVNNSESNGSVTGNIDNLSEMDSYLIDMNTYKKQLEEELKEILSSVEGAGNVQVMITFKSSSKKEVLMEEPYTESSLEESDGDGGSRKTSESIKDYTVIYSEDGNGTVIPFVISETSPKVEGVAVVAEGGDKAVVKEKITGIIKALFGIEINKIAVGKMK